MSYFSTLGDWINHNPWKATGAVAGLVSGVLIFTIGFVKTFIVALLIFIGFVIGKSRDENISIADAVMRLFSGKKED